MLVTSDNVGCGLRAEYAKLRPLRSSVPLKLVHRDRTTKTYSSVIRFIGAYDRVGSKIFSVGEIARNYDVHPGQSSKGLLSGETKAVEMQQSYATPCILA
jgi:hypothetical protein